MSIAGPARPRGPGSTAASATLWAANVDRTSPLPMVLVTLGTDHHRFDRLMDWVQAWLERYPARARIVVQHGSSHLPAGADGFALCSHEELLTWIKQADLVITQGGPGGIMDSRECGVLPIVVARVAALREAVDDHQVAFTAHMARAGLAVAVASQQQFDDALTLGLADLQAMRIDVAAASAEPAIIRTGELIEALVRSRPPRRRRRPRAAAATDESA